MVTSVRKAFAERLIGAMLQHGYKAARNAKTGVDVGLLAKKAETTREMARRYVSGIALPDPERMKKIAAWLELRVAYLRDGEGAPAGQIPNAADSAHAAELYGLTTASIEIARVWQSLPEERQRMYREMLFMEAAVNKLVPWLRMQPPNGERYLDFEQRVQKDFARFAQQLTLSF